MNLVSTDKTAMRTHALIPALVTILACGCRATYDVSVSAVPITSVLVTPFKCEDPIVADAVRNVFIGFLTKNSNARILREGTADVVVEGTVTATVGGSSGKGGFSQNESSSGGAFVSGVTALVTRNGEVLTSAEWGQALKGGRGLLAPEEVARRGADRLVRELRRHGLGRKGE